MGQMGSGPRMDPPGCCPGSLLGVWSLEQGQSELAAVRWGCTEPSVALRTGTTLRSLLTACPATPGKQAAALGSCCSGLPSGR